MGTFTYNQENSFVVILNIMHIFNLCEGVVVIFIILGILQSAGGLKEHLNIRVNKFIVRENNETKTLTPHLMFTTIFLHQYLMFTIIFLQQHLMFTTIFLHLYASDRLLFNKMLISSEIHSYAI
jgi:hypothetical protein